MSKSKKICFHLAIMTAVLVALPLAQAQEFYRGKTVRFIVGYGPGGGYDNYTRLIARHIGKHVPGHPTTVVENMEGAGSLLLANYLYSRAEPDGLTVGNWNSSLITHQALGDKGVRFDARKFGWIGAPVKGSPVCAIMAFTGLKTLDEILASKREIKFGATGSGANTDDIPKLLNALLGTKFKIVPGYKGSADIRLAMKRKEVDAICITWDSMRATARAELEAKGDDRMIPFIIHGSQQDPEVKHVPQVLKVLKGEDNLATWKAYANPTEMQRPLMVPPKAPKDRLNMLRRAFDKTLQDPEFLAEANKSKFITDPVSGEEVEKLVDEILAMPPGAKEKLSLLIKPD